MESIKWNMIQTRRNYLTKVTEKKSGFLFCFPLILFGMSPHCNKKRKSMVPYSVKNRAWNERRSLAKEVLTELKLKRELSLKLHFTARAGSGQRGHRAKAFIKHFSHQLQYPRNNAHAFFHLTQSKFFCRLGGKSCLDIHPPPAPPLLVILPISVLYHREDVGCVAGVNHNGWSWFSSFALAAGCGCFYLFQPGGCQF